MVAGPSVLAPSLVVVVPLVVVAVAVGPAVPLPVMGAKGEEAAGKKKERWSV